MDKVKVTGVDAKGYGKVYKLAMRDTTLSLVAKALLAYLCSYAGSGTSAFPRREKILRDMGINKDTFCKYMKALEQQSYITRHKTNSGSVYEIMQFVTGVNGAQIEVKSAGYGTIPKLVMLDSNLSAKAKGLYAYLCSFAGSGKSAWPKVATVLRDLSVSRNSYNKYLDELVGIGYISAAQKHESGRYGSNVYTLNETVFAPISNSSLQRPLKATNQPRPSAPIVVENCVENAVETVEIQNSTSEKIVSEKTAPQIFGHRNKNNKSTINSSLSFDKEEKGNKNNLAFTHEKIGVKTSPMMTRKQVKELIGYMDLYAECISWATLKETLGHFKSVGGRERFVKHSKTIVDELANQVFLFFKATGDSVLVGGILRNRESLQAALKHNLDADALSNLCCDTVNRGSEIKSLKNYLKASILNLAVASTDLSW